MISGLSGALSGTLRKAANGEGDLPAGKLRGLALAILSLALVVIAFQAFLVLGFMMHLLSERHMIYTVLAFTGFFLLALMFLTVSSVNEVLRKPHHAPEVTAQATH